MLAVSAAKICQETFKIVKCKLKTLNLKDFMTFAQTKKKCIYSVNCNYYK